MERKRKFYKTFTLEFKIEAVRLIETSEHPSSEVARELGIRRNQLSCTISFLKIDKIHNIKTME